jgi:broad specificity phosphatase PhoE
VNIGELETDSPPINGRSLFDGIIRSWLIEEGKQIRFPGGEDRYMLTGRVKDGLFHVVGRHPDGCVVIVGHVLPLTVTLKEIIRAGADPRWIEMPMPYGSITVMNVVAEMGRLSADLVSWAKQEHLKA